MSVEEPKAAGRDYLVAQQSRAAKAILAALTPCKVKRSNRVSRANATRGLKTWSFDD